MDNCIASVDRARYLLFEVQMYHLVLGTFKAELSSVQYSPSHSHIKTLALHSLLGR